MKQTKRIARARTKAATLRRALITLLLPLSFTSLTACNETEPETQAVTKTVTVAAATSRETKKPRRMTKAQPTSKPAAYARCDQNIRAKTATTTCEFASNTFYEYWYAAGARSITVYSPAAGKTFATTCRPRNHVVICTTTDGGAVRFPRRAVDAYTENDAAAYAAAHDVTPIDTPDPNNVDTEEPAPAFEEECDPNYEGACLDPNASDYDCEGGSGDGPFYTGPVRVVGYDRHGLDRDGDGYACE